MPVKKKFEETTPPEPTATAPPPHGGQWRQDPQTGELVLISATADRAPAGAEE